MGALGVLVVGSHLDFKTMNYWKEKESPQYLEILMPTVIRGIHIKPAAV